MYEDLLLKVPLDLLCGELCGVFCLGNAESLPAELRVKTWRHLTTAMCWLRVVAREICVALYFGKQTDVLVAVYDNCELTITDSLRILLCMY